ncbi:hypothetical protein O6H91_Y013700 [Diphasiastrum complanatum]|nr:hypothetical protein O6H91_Y013700 [Diphasiastrum complanatum]
MEDGTGKRSLVFAEQTSPMRKSHGFDPVSVKQVKSIPLQQRAVNFKNYENGKSNLSGEYVSEAIEGSRSPNMHPLEQIERSLPHKLTLQLWQEEERFLRVQIQTHEIDCSRTEQEIYQLFGFDVLFQAIIIAGAAQATVLDCSSAWVPLVLSIAASLATFLAVFRKLEAHERFLSELQSEQSDAKALFEYVEKLKMLGGQFDLNDVPHSSSVKRRENRYPSAMDKVLKVIWSYKFFVLIVLLVFSILAVVSFKKILCSQ